MPAAATTACTSRPPARRRATLTPATSPGCPSARSPGFVNNPSYTYFDPTTKGAWFYDGSTLWAGDSPQSVQAKADYQHCNGLAGAMMYSMEALDPAATLFNAVINDTNGATAGCVGASPTGSPSTSPSTSPTVSPTVSPTSESQPVAGWLHRSGVAVVEGVRRRRHGVARQPHVAREVGEPRTMTPARPTSRRARGVCEGGAPPPRRGASGPGWPRASPSPSSGTLPSV